MSCIVPQPVFAVGGAYAQRCPSDAQAMPKRCPNETDSEADTESDDDLRDPQRSAKPSGKDQAAANSRAAVLPPNAKLFDRTTLQGFWRVAPRMKSRSGDPST